MKAFKYYVVGGQYTQHFYGGSNTLHGAKILATKNAEYWDNWQGWHTPAIYNADDTRVIETETGSARVLKDRTAHNHWHKIDNRWCEIGFEY